MKSKPKSKVYVVNQSTHDYSNAEKFGDIEFLTKGNFHILNTSRMAREFIVALKYSNPNDYIMPCGLSVMSLIAGGIFILMHKRINLLIYFTDRQGGGEYKARTLNFEELSKGD